MTASTTAQGRKFSYQGSIDRLFKCRDRLILMGGPTRTGKTRGIQEKALLFGLKYDMARILFTRKVRASMSETVLQTWEDDVLPEEWRGYQKRANRDKYELPNSSQVVICGIDHAIKIMSSEFDLICVFEATELSEDDLEFLVTRLSGKAGPYRQLIADCNPAGPNHHLKRRCDAGKMTYIPSTHKDNPRWWDEAAQAWTPQGREYLQTLETLTGHRRARLKDGVWAAAEGLVYPEFDPAVHIIDEMPKGWESWRKVRSIDFGFTNPFVCGFWAIDHDGRMYLYREIYHSRRTVADHAREIKTLPGMFEATTADHDAEDRATLDQHGIPTVPAKKDIETGLQAVRSRLRIADDGKPRIFFLAGATLSIDTTLEAEKRPVSTASEFDGYVWARNRDGTVVKEVPVDRDNHGMDMVRYAVMYVDNPAAAPSVAWVEHQPETPSRGRTLDEIDRWFDEED